MAGVAGRELVERFYRAVSTRDWDLLGSVLHPDYCEVYPQSGERIRGTANLRAILEHYPGGFTGDIGTRRLIGSEDRWVLTPSFTPLRVSGTGDVYMFEGTAPYPDGTTWHVVSLLELKDGRIWRLTSYYAAPFEAPAWRAQWVERA